MAFNKLYDIYKKQFFPKLLEDPKVSPEDKVKIREYVSFIEVQMFYATALSARPTPSR
jgi:hypothetical protein